MHVNILVKLAQMKMNVKLAMQTRRDRYYRAITINNVFVLINIMMMDKIISNVWPVIMHV